MDNNKIRILTLLDLSAGFDTIDHQILLTRLQHSFVISGPALSWFSSYLSNRTHAVTINSLQSEHTTLHYGVTQGSVLGPVLFILYTQPLFNLVSKHAVSHHAFADDNQLYKISTLDAIHQSIETLQNCTIDVKSWMTANKLQLNDNKTEAMIILSNRMSVHSPLPSVIHIGDTDVPFVLSVKNLGVTLDSNLSMSQHISNTCKAAYIQIRHVSSIRHLLTTQATQTLVCSLVLSRLDYCNSLLSGCPQYYYWSLLYSAILHSWADSLRWHVILHEWIAFYSAFLNIHRSGVLTALAWLVPQESAARESQSRRVLCTPYNHAPCHFMQSHIRKVDACLAVTCHLRFWQNDRGLLHATAVTRGWNGYRNKSQHRKLTLEKKILLPLQQGFEPATFRSRVRRSNHWAIPAPQYLLDKLQKVQNAAARLVCKAKKSDHIHPILQTLHWLPVTHRIQYKISTMCFNSISGTAPQYLSDLLQPYTPARQLRSASDTRTFVTPPCKNKNIWWKIFFLCWPIWNNSPQTLRHSDSTSSFKATLKTHLFNNYF